MYNNRKVSESLSTTTPDNDLKLTNGAIISINNNGIKSNVTSRGSSQPPAKVRVNNNISGGEEEEEEEDIVDTRSQEKHLVVKITGLKTAG